MKRKPVFFALLFVLAVVSALLLLRRPPPVPPPVVLRPTSRQAAQAQSDMESLQREWQPEASPPQQVPKSHVGRTQSLIRPRTLRLSEEDLNVYLASNRVARRMLAARGIKTVQIVLSEPAGLTLRAAVIVNKRTQNVQIDGSLAPDSKAGIRFTATRAQVGRFPLPAAVVTAQANAQVARFVRQMHGRLPLLVQSVGVQGRMLVLIGIPLRQAERSPRGPAIPGGASLAHHS